MNMRPNYTQFLRGMFHKAAAQKKTTFNVLHEGIVITVRSGGLNKIIQLHDGKYAINIIQTPEGVIISNNYPNGVRSLEENKHYADMIATTGKIGRIFDKVTGGK